MDILRGNTVIATVHPTDDSVYSCNLMGDNAVKLNFKSSIAISMLIGDAIVYNGATFTLNSQPTVKEVSTREYEYTCEFQAVDSELKKVEYRLFDNTPIPPQAEFSLMGTARTFVQLIVDNMNRIQTGWTLGQVLDTEFKSLDFSTENCLTVIQNIAKAFNTEFYITAPKVINLQQKPYVGAVIDLEYGMGNGLKSLTKLKNNDSALITSLHVLGGSRNLPLGYRDGSQRLMLASGLPLQNNVDKFGVIEGTKVFDGIYPRLAAGVGNDPGKVTANAGLYQFTDTNLDFDVNQYLSDSTAKVVFLTGELAGYQFEIASYIHATKTFTINPATYENSIELPSANFHAAPGDKYVLIDVLMPQVYVDRSEAELLATAISYLPVVSNLTDNYTGDCDPLHFRRNNISITIGQIVRIISAQLGINKEIRVIGINQNLNNPFIYKLEFGDIISGRLAALESDVAGIAKTSTSASKTLSQTDSLIVQLKNSSLRRYSDAKGVSKRINDFTHAASVLDNHRLEVDKESGLESEYVEASQLAAYIADKYKFSYNAVLNRFETAVDLYSAGKIIAGGTIQFFGSGSGGPGGGGSTTLWGLSDVSDDVANAVYGDLIMYNGTHFARINQSVLAPAVHTHSIAQVNGLQIALDGKQAAGSYVLTSDGRLSDARVASDVYAWAKQATKPNYAYSEIGGTVPIWNQNTTGNAATVNNIRFDFAAFSIQPYYFWGVNADGAQSKVWPTSALSVSYATNSGQLNGRSDYLALTGGTLTGDLNAINVNAQYIRLRTNGSQSAKFGSDTYNRAVAIGSINGEPSIQGLVDNSDVPRQLQINPSGGAVSFGGAGTFAGSVAAPSITIDSPSSFNINSIQFMSTGLTSRFYSIGLLPGTGGNSAFGIYDNYGGSRFWIDYDGTSNFTGSATFIGGFNSRTASSIYGAATADSPSTARQLRIGVDGNTSYEMTFGYYLKTGLEYVGVIQSKSGGYSTLSLNPSGGNVTCGAGLIVNGNITSNGTMQFYTASDRRLKTDFEAIANPIEKIKSLTGYFFNYTDQAMSLGGYASRRDIGLIAQDVYNILPEATGKLWNTDFMGYKADKLIPLLVEAIKQQQNEIDQLKRQIAA